MVPTELLTPTSLFLLLNIVIGTILVSSAFNKQHKKQPRDSYNGDSAAAPHSAAPQQLVRTPSLFSRVTSFNFSNYYPHHTADDDGGEYEPRHHSHHGTSSGSPDTVARAPSLLSRVASFNFSGRAGSGPVAARQSEELDVRENRAAAVAPAATAATRAFTPSSLLYRVSSFNFSGPRRAGSGPVVTRQEECEACDVRREKKVGQQLEEKVVKANKKKKKAMAAAAAAAAKETTEYEEEVDVKADDFINKFKQQLKLQRLESLLRSTTA